MPATKTLSKETITIIKSTVPVLAEHGEVITKRFYEMMFSNHPELLNIFNHAHQKQGKQPKALANTVYAAAMHIDNLEAIIPVVKQIAHKHRSLNIKAEHYPIVGKHLLLAIKDVLGDAATDDIINAWGEAYGIIADVFISVEKEMYEEAAREAGGWKEYRKFVVNEKIKESDVITSFYLKPEDGGNLAKFEPGQYISIKAVIDGEEYTHIRQYSLSDSPGKDYYRISVKREDKRENAPEGIVSNFLHDAVNVGDVLEITSPAGDFVLNMETQLPIVLISGGVGLTPMVSMLKTLADIKPEKEVTYIHAAISGQTHSLQEEVSKIASENKNISTFICYEAPTETDLKAGNYQKEGYIDLPWLQSILKTNQAEFYFCGPVPFMKVINEALTKWGVPKERIHFEFFGPAADL
ncbi:NO-inducible flavohemoprotein [Anaerobacillus isosaccharinicus]|uniref:Flavohemoprotein n=1 Tax=Anaerobacillus isosaccharinicus TaxID=1532552 RepID=A0A1S2MDM7_9BACI|nr:NO-inducible flavohemoprotein [Anaerobacillus isosaccharinicus]MBA5586718.1 NO-inducible flavohemoprotein [Anaerobacillus isosaccharinicus]QOY35059.1 NO-inducible flavohemoprotein [Anaerobacillus isosaccharinicus]